MRSGLERLYIKDESLNPTNSFKARGLSAAVTRAAHLKARTLSVPSAGNAANAMAAYAALAGLEAQVFMPRDVKVPFIRECELYGAVVNLVDGLITDAGRIAAEKGKPLGWYDVSTLKEPYRIEGKKTMAYEIGEQLGWDFPDWIVYPTGGGTGMVGMWKAFEELEQIGWKHVQDAAEDGLRPGRELRADRARVRERRRALRDVAERPHHRRRPASAEGHRRFPRASRHPRERRHRHRRVRRRDGLGDARAGIEGRDQRGARKAAPRCRRSRCSSRDGRIRPTDSVVLFNTGGALKYLDVLAYDVDLRRYAHG